MAMLGSHCTDLTQLRPFSYRVRCSNLLFYNKIAADL